MKIRLIATDLDDTLLDHQCCISPRAREAFRRAQEKDIYVTIATGRMYRSALPFALELGIDVPLITYQGALVKTSVTQEVLYHRPVPGNLAGEVIRAGEKEGLTVNLYVNDRLYVNNDTPAARAYAGMARVPMTPVKDLLSFLNHDDPTKILMIGDEKKLDDLWIQMEEKFGDTLYITKSKPQFLEFTHPQATKGQGLMAVADLLGIKKEEILALGDSYNDLELFRHAGFAVAMDNARDDIKREADYVTCSNNDDGVAEAIEKLVLG